MQSLQAALAHGAGFDPGKDTRTFQILASDNGFVMAGVDLVRRVAQFAPQLRLAFRSVPVNSFANWLESGSADLLIAADFSIPAGMQSRALFHERYVMAHRKGHPRGLAPPDLDAYSALGHVLVSGDGGGFHGFMDDLLARAGRRRVAISVAALPPRVAGAGGHRLRLCAARAFPAAASPTGSTCCRCRSRWPASD
ncbi:MAG: LysR substrate-binding domain-containing protein [Burkholderia sp.]